MLSIEDFSDRNDVAIFITYLIFKRSTSDLYYKEPFPDFIKSLMVIMENYFSSNSAIRDAAVDTAKNYYETYFKTLNSNNIHRRRSHSEIMLMDAATSLSYSLDETFIHRVVCRHSRNYSFRSVHGIAASHHKMESFFSEILLENIDKLLELHIVRRYPLRNPENIFKHLSEAKRIDFVFNINTLIMERI